MQIIFCSAADLDNVQLKITQEKNSHAPNFANDKTFPSWLWHELFALKEWRSRSSFRQQRHYCRSLQEHAPLLTSLKRCLLSSCLFLSGPTRCLSSEGGVGKRDEKKVCWKEKQIFSNFWLGQRSNHELKLKRWLRFLYLKGNYILVQSIFAHQPFNNRISRNFWMLEISHAGKRKEHMYDCTCIWIESNKNFVKRIYFFKEKSCGFKLGRAIMLLLCDT